MIRILWPILLGAAVLGPAPADAGTFRARSVEHDLAIVEFDAEALRAASASRRPVVAERFPLPGGSHVDLELQPFSVTGPRTRFVVGRKGRADLEADYDPARITFLRGSVRGRPGSHVFLALGGEHTTGSIDLGAGAPRYALSSRDGSGHSLGDGRASVFRTTGRTGLAPDVPLCGSDHLEHGPPEPTATATAASTVGLKHLELAVDTDYEFFEIFGDAQATFDYLVVLYAAISDIYIRDVDTWVELTFARVWDDPDDLFNEVEPTPLFDFQDHWNLYMGGVQRDAAQLASGRSDYPFGGQAYVGALCGGNAYSVVGYMTGVLADPSRPSPLHYDIEVAAHELGHNAGTGHTQDNGIDSCNNPNTTPQRGSIMSYCQQTWSGGNSNQDLYFHSVIQQNIDAYIDFSPCIVPDCNQNGIDDAVDLSGGSPDQNLNGIPDECEDCNGNLVLDDADIADETSLDQNGNGIPDECEPDCDGNGVPDDKQIADGDSLDLYGDDVPDECEPDCNGNLVSDYTEIQANMPLDIDRDLVLDACQDCDGDGTTDHDVLDSAHNLWVASGLPNSVVREFHGVTGVKILDSGGDKVQEGQDVVVTAAGRVLVSSAANHRIMEFDLAGSFVGDFVAPAAGGMTHPTGMLETPDGRLLVASRDTDSVLAFDAADGSLIGELVPAGSGGLVAPFGMTLGPGGSLFVTSDAGEVLEYDVDDGEFESAFVSVLANGGLNQPRGLTFKPDGNLLVASFGTNEVLEYDGTTGKSLGKWANVGTSSNLTQVSPWGIRVGPNGNVFVVRTGEDYGSGVLSDGLHHDHAHADADMVDVDQLHLTNAQIYEFDAVSGDFVRTHIGGNDHNMLFPSGFAFVGGWDVDCNRNLLPDTCDIASGDSADADGSGIPDECEVDCNANGRLDRLDVIPYGPSRDCNTNLSPDECDIATGGSNDCTGNGTPDECEPDCNGNGTADSCDIQAAVSKDCNSNGVPDECDALDDFESNSGWQAGAPGDTATDGTWERVNPNGTEAQPEYDHTPGDGRECFVTGQGPIAGSGAADDVDGGTTTLLSPIYDLSGDPDPWIGYWRWLSNDTGPNPGEDVLTVDVSANGGLSWVNVEVVGPGGVEASGGWYYHVFRVADLVLPTANVRLRFVAADTGGDSIVEAAVDDVGIVPGCCQSAASCDDGVACTLDTCHVPAGQCNSDLQPATCLIDHVCYADGDLNPLDDCEGCDAEAPFDWSDTSPVEVSGLLLQKDGATRLTWDEQGPGFVYDVAGGLVSVLRASGSVSGAACVQDDVGAGPWDDPQPDPPAGDGYYYLVRSQKSCGPGSYGTDSAGEERQPLVDCP